MALIFKPSTFVSIFPSESVAIKFINSFRLLFVMAFFQSSCFLSIEIKHTVSFFSETFLGLPDIGHSFQAWNTPACPKIYKDIFPVNWQIETFSPLLDSKLISVMSLVASTCFEDCFNFISSFILAFIMLWMCASTLLLSSVSGGILTGQGEYA